MLGPNDTAAREIELQALASAQSSSAAQLLKSHQRLVQKFAADRAAKTLRQRSSQGQDEGDRGPRGLVQVSGRVNGGTIDRRPAPLQWRAMTRSKRRKRRQQFSAIRMRSRNDPRQSSLPPVQTVTPLTRCACKPTIRHHPPTNSDSCSMGYPHLR